MAQTLEELLTGVHSTTVTDISVLVREVRVRVGVLSEPVTIRIYYDAKSPASFTYEISAVMETGSGDDVPDAPSSSTSENEALRRAVRTLTRAYEDAVRRGEIPDDRWLSSPPPLQQ